MLVSSDHITSSNVSPMYTRILEAYLVPFIRDVYPMGHKFMQDNDPKHTSRCAQQFFEEHSINWWKTPPESPDANTIEICGMN